MENPAKEDAGGVGPKKNDHLLLIFVSKIIIVVFAVKVFCVFSFLRRKERTDRGVC